jgi:putative hydrolase of the HAD superfamily
VLRAVTFDYWDTLLRIDPATSIRDLQINAFADELAAADHPRDRALLEVAFEENWDRFETAWVGNRGQYTPGDSTEFLAGRLGVTLTDRLRARLVGSFRKAGELASLELASGVVECLTDLRAAGLRLGIVCDVGLTSSPTLRERLTAFGLLRLFDAWAFSDETGWFKPAARAFEPACMKLGVAAHEVAHVGDSPRTDVAGALALGMTAVRFAGFVDRPGGADPEHPEAPFVVRDHREIPAVLGLS